MTEQQPDARSSASSALDHPDAYAAYLQARHAGFEAPRPLVEAMVQRATGQSVTALERIVAGNDNEVYAVTPSQGSEFVVRIHRSASCTLTEEAWALAQARAAGVPVPDVLLVDQIEHEGAPLDFMVQTRLAGRPLEDRLPHLGHQDRERTLHAMGRTLAQLHMVAVDGFYRRRPDGRWDFPDWFAFMDRAARDRAAEAPWLHVAGFSPRDIDSTMELIQQYDQAFDCPQPVLCHGDFVPEHVFFDDDLRIVGVIDFGQYEGNHPVHDFALLSMMADERIESAVRRGYAEVGILDDQFDFRLHLHRLMLEVGYLAHHIQIPGHPEVPRYAQGLRSTLRWLRARRDTPSASPCV